MLQSPLCGTALRGEPDRLAKPPAIINHLHPLTGVTKMNAPYMHDYAYDYVSEENAEEKEISSLFLVFIIFLFFPFPSLSSLLLLLFIPFFLHLFLL